MSESPKIENVEPANFTSDHVQSMGKQFATFLAASVFELGVAGNICETLGAMNKADPKIKKEFQECVWLVLGQALDDGVAGAVKRNELAHALRTVENDLRKEAWNVAVEKTEKGTEDTVKLLEGLVRTADQCSKAAKALYSSIQRNLNSLIEDGHRYMTMKGISDQVRSKKEDKMHDADCDDPNCNGHINH